MKTSRVILPSLVLLCLFSSQAVAAPELTPLAADAFKSQLKKGDFKATVLNLWAPWCDPCRDEMPELIRLRKDRLAKGASFRLVLLTGDQDTDLKEAGDFLGEKGVDFPVYKLSESPLDFMKTFMPAWPTQVPTTLLFDQEGRLTAKWIGRIKIKDVERKVDEILRRNPVKRAKMPPQPKA